MARVIIKIKDGMDLMQLTNHIREQYGQCGVDALLSERLPRVESTGTSVISETLADVLSCNKAGDGEMEISADDIYRIYDDAQAGEEESDGDE